MTALLAFALLPGCTNLQEKETAAEAAPDPGIRTSCIPEAIPADAMRVVLVSAGGAEATKPATLREMIESYLRVRVHTVPMRIFDPDSLEGARALVIYGDTDIPDEAAAVRLIEAASAAEIPVTWIGPGASTVEGHLNVAMDTSGVAFDPAPRGARMIYRNTEVPFAGVLMAEALPASSSAPVQVLAEYRGPGGTRRPAIALRDDLLHIGFDPLDGAGVSHAMVIAMDALAGFLKPRQRDPRVVFRLEDLNPSDYDDNDSTLTEVAQYLLSRGVFLHLAVIPEYVNAEGQVVGDVGDMAALRRILEAYPDRTELVQHGFRHYRPHPRNAGMASGDAHEFFFDDDESLGVGAAALMARRRLDAGRRLVEAHLRPVWSFEAPHHAMSPAEEDVAEELYDMIHHPPLNRRGEPNPVLTPWFTIRGKTAYAPSSAGYVELEEDDSITRMLARLEDVSALMPDPVMLVFFHPFIWNEPGRRDDLRVLIDGIEALGYRFVSACQEVSRGGADAERQGHSG